MSDSSCRLCGGTGSIDDFGFYDVPCPDCNGTGEQPDPIVAYEWTHEERPCHCTPEHRPAVQRTLGWLLVIGMIAVFVALEVWR